LLMQSHGEWLVDQADSVRHFRIRTKRTMRRAAPISPTHREGCEATNGQL
jgi:hypothetical protein